MIKYVARHELNDERYNECITQSLQSEIYAYSWYLDLVVKNWGVFIFEDYKAVMPIPWNKKYGIKYVYPPFWILQLGIFFKTNEFSELVFIEQLKRNFKFAELRMNTKNHLELESKNFFEKSYHTLDINDTYDFVKSKYRSDRLKDLKKAAKNNLKEVWNDNIQKLIDLFTQNIGKKTPNITFKDYDRLEKLMNHCIRIGVGETLSIYDSKENLVASAFFLKHQKSITILCSSTDFKNRNNGANTFLIDKAIEKYQPNYNTFYFGGSSIQTVGKYFKSFGAEKLTYQMIKMNNLPFFLKLFKK